MKIFISYRRDDTAGHAGRLFDYLAAHFEVKNIFMDIDTIQPGEDFRKVVANAVATCDVVLVLIGRHWLGITDAQGRRRLDDPRDLVRLEVATALANKQTLVIPVLVRGAGMPGEQELPDDLKELTGRNASELSDSRFQHDAGKLVDVIERAIASPWKKLLVWLYRRNVRRGLGFVLGLSALGFIAWTVNGVVNARMSLAAATPTHASLASNTPVSSSPSQTAVAISIPTLTPAATLTFNPTSSPTITPTNLPTLTSTPVIIEQRGVAMVQISAGFFEMSEGSDSNQIYVNAFYIDQYEVTNGEYKKCVDAGACAQPFTNAATEFDNVVHFEDQAYARFPIVLINWNMAQNYCTWRGSDTRLPTDLEWEKAARGTLVNQAYPWGNALPVCSTGNLHGANFSDCGTRDTIPVGSYSANGYGIYDMAGNVAEWIDKSVSGTNQMIRGGSFNDSPGSVRIDSVFLGAPSSGYTTVGFRCAKPIP